MARQRAGTGSTGPVLKFPEDLSTHFFSLQARKFQHDKAGNEKTLPIGMILLPVPTNVVENQGVSYNEVEMGALGGELADQIAKMNFNQAADAIGNYFKGVAEAGADLTSAKGRKELAQKLKDPNNAAVNAVSIQLRKMQNPIGFGLNRYFGSAPNPHVTTMFRGVQLRNHTFTWLLAPQSYTETQILKMIIQQFRQSMLPQRTASNMTLAFPDQWHLRFSGGLDGAISGRGGNLPPKPNSMYQFKPAVLRNLQINYAPTGNPSFFRTTGAPTHVQISVDFLETAIHTRDDYDTEWGPGTRGDGKEDRITPAAASTATLPAGFDWG